MDFSSADGDRQYAAVVRAADSLVVGPRLRRRAGPDRGRPRPGRDPPRRPRDAARPGRGGPRRRGDHRPPRAAGARPRRSGRGRQPARRTRPRSLRLRPVRQRALVLPRPPRDLAKAAARAGHADERAAPDPAPVRRRGRVDRGEGARDRRPHPTDGRPAGRVRPAARPGHRGRQESRPHRRAGPDGDRGPRRRHGQGQRGPQAGRGPRRPVASSSSATTSATSRRSRPCWSSATAACPPCSSAPARTSSTPCSTWPTWSSPAPTA